MSHFEYVSVAIALIYTLAIGRLLGGLSFSLTVERQYWVHTTWISTLLLVSIMSWWAMWGLRDVTWTPARFLWALAIPALLYVRTNILLGRPGEEPDSYYEHFYAKRRLFFSLGIGVSLLLAFTPWVQGLLPWLELGAIHINAANLAIVSILGLCCRNHAVHAVLVIVSLIGSASGFFTL